jgi:hypothetical protein
MRVVAIRRHEKAAIHVSAAARFKAQDSARGLEVGVADREDPAFRHRLTRHRRLRPYPERLPGRVIVAGLHRDHDHPSGSRGVENHTSTLISSVGSQGSLVPSNRILTDTDA